MSRANSEQPLRVVFWGTPDFAIPTLQVLLTRAVFHVVAVVTNLDAPAGRNRRMAESPVKVLARKESIPVEQPNSLNDERFIEKLYSYKSDIFVVVAYGKIIPATTLSVAKHGALNIHPSLLPKFRGPSPVESAILFGEKETGASIMLMDEKMDHGPILLQKSIPIAKSDTRISLSQKLFRLGSELLVEAVPGWLAKAIQPTPQNDSEATYTKLLSRESGRLFWDNSAKVLERQVRAYLGWPGTYAIWERGGQPLRLKITDARATPERHPTAQYGTTWKSAKTPLAVQTLDGSLKILRLQLEGGKSLKAEEFTRGYPDIIGTILL
ncbi:MAG: methionyl-tRNA formyltransferase [Candidatus Sungbacteria bacterium]|nr:methionyl-tRNA formyltransferase [Candidatus Sungbacteria bacterium]